jgi:hypothetical protein
LHQHLTPLMTSGQDLTALAEKLYHQPKDVNARARVFLLGDR